jgi:hypothetical protein
VEELELESYFSNCNTILKLFQYTFLKGISLDSRTETFDLR